MTAAALALSVALIAAPGYEALSKRELWDMSLRAKAKHDTVFDALGGCHKKLATRTSTVINNLILPDRAAPGPAESREWWFAGGVAVGVLVVIGAGFAIKPAR